MEKGKACPACTFNHKRCHPNCEGRVAFRKIITKEEYRTIFSIFHQNNLAQVLTDVPEPQYTEVLQSYLMEARERTNNPFGGGCEARMVSLEKRMEEIYWRVASLETRLDGGSSSADL